MNIDNILHVEPTSNTVRIIEPTSYFEKIRRLCDEHNIFLIFDEVLTGQNRKNFKSDYLTIDPDILTAGKALSNEQHLSNSSPYEIC